MSSSNSWCNVRDSSLIMYPLIYITDLINHIQDTLRSIFSHSANSHFLPNLRVLLFLPVTQFVNINCRISKTT